MTEEERPQLEHTHGEYRDEEDAEGDYNEYDENEEEYYEGEDGGEDEEGANAQVGEEIALTHEEVWDDSALIEAWDAAVKQYEVYHSKKQPDETIVSTPLTKTKNKAVEPESPALPPKRAKLSNDPSNVVTNGQPSGTGTIESEAAPTDQQLTPSLKPVIPPNTPVYAVSERKPSFKKADKPSFSHHKVPQQKKATKTGLSGKIGASTSKPIKATAPSAPPPVDAATIAYYQQLGYYYDPTYLGADAAEAGNEEQEHEVEEDETATRIRASTSANPSSAFPNARNRVPMPAYAAAAVEQSGPFGHGHAGAAYPYYPYHPHVYDSPHIPARATAPPAAGGGGFGFPGMPGMPLPGMPLPGMPLPGMPLPGMTPPSWGVPGAGARPRTGVPAGAANRHYPMAPPMPQAGQFSASAMDDDALSNLIMAWYFSGYYTGLYQAQRRN